MSDKREWVSEWTHRGFGEQLMASACLHGLLFSSRELVHSWLKSRTRNLFNHELVEILERMIVDQVRVRIS